MTSPRKGARRHHLVPKLYLRGFASERDQLIRVPLGGNPHPQSINDATVQKDYYTVNREGIEPDDFEKTLGSIESEFAPVLRDVLNGSKWPLDDRDRSKFSLWIALQHLRGESIRKSIEEMYRATAKLEVGVFSTSQIRDRLRLDESFTDQQVEEIRARMLATADTFKVDHHQHLSLIAEMLSGMANVVFHRRPWVLTEFQRKRIGTCDTPVVLIPGHSNLYSGVGVALGTAGELLIPLDRRRVLVLGELGGKESDIHGYGNAKMANAVNSFVARSARKAVYHHPEDTPFSRTVLPDKPRDKEMEISGPNINELIESFARTQGRSSGLPSSDQR